MNSLNLNCRGHVKYKGKSTSAEYYVQSTMASLHVLSLPACNFGPGLCVTVTRCQLTARDEHVCQSASHPPLSEGYGIRPLDRGDGQRGDLIVDRSDWDKWAAPRADTKTRNRPQNRIG